MDLASGIFAVISLSIQLIETVKKIQAFCKDVKHAPEEILRFIGTLQQVQTVLEQTKIYLEDRSKTHNMPGSTFAIECAIRSCYSDIGRLAEMVDHVSAQHTRQNRRTVLWSSVKVVFKKEELERSRHLLHEDLSILQAAILLAMSQTQ